MEGRFLTSEPSCCSACGQSIRVGGSVHYLADAADSVRLGDCCVTFDLFGAVA